MNPEPSTVLERDKRNGNASSSGRETDADSTAGMERIGSHREYPQKKSHSMGRSWQALMNILDTKEQEDTEHPSSEEKQTRWQWWRNLTWPAFWKWFLQRWTFYRIHFTAFFILMMIGTLFFYISPNGPGGTLGFVDAMYVATSAVCNVGLFPVYMNQLSAVDKAFLIVLILVGNQVLTSLVPVLVRRFYFQKYLKREGILEVESLTGSSTGGQWEDRMKEVADCPPLDEEQPMGSQRRDESRVGFRIVEEQEMTESSSGRRNFLSESSGTPQNALRRSPSNPNLLPDSSDVDPPTPRRTNRRLSITNNPLAPFLALDDDVPDRATNTWAGETAEMNARRLKAILEAARARNTPEAWQSTPFLRSATSKFREAAGNPDNDSVFDTASLLPGERRFIELRSLELLTWLVPVYILGFQVTAWALFVTLLYTNTYYLQFLDVAGIHPVFFAAFQSASAFTNFGVNLLDNNLADFLSYVPYILLESFLILVGNTLYAPTLRFLLMIICKFGTQHQKLVATYLLEHPRKCYTHLYPAQDTIWLVVTVLLFNSVEFIFFCILDWNTEAIINLPTGLKILAGYFQSISTRNAGTTVITISLLSDAMLVLYAAMMYIAVYPVYITRQRSREQREVYDDDDMRIFYEDLEEGVLEKGVFAQGKKMIMRDSAFLFLSVFIVCIIEKDEMNEDPLNYSIFNIVFEIISAYGCVGLSMGITCPAENPPPSCVSVPYSFSGVWRPLGKLIIILVMFLGRHRGLPDNIDAAIAIPDQKRFQRVMPAPDENTAPLLTRMSSVVASLPPHAHSHSLQQSGSFMNRSSPANIRTVSGENIVSPR